jgi:hypothetical protein
VTTDQLSDQLINTPESVPGSRKRNFAAVSFKASSVHTSMRTLAKKAEGQTLLPKSLHEVAAILDSPPQHRMIANRASPDESDQLSDQLLEAAWAAY